ncbi:unnamed protein product [Angiostrongylus costaricensis]|uniref:Ribonuc_red_lgN domain-containing protein n=1 Tax=Angiostrongylus costaricensis TaxID=334426 RepID=A0A0R3PTL0_ANGCS|nr:unnamed protein product [Angiostrongylus costaricensis]
MYPYELSFHKRTDEMANLEREIAFVTVEGHKLISSPAFSKILAQVLLNAGKRSSDAEVWRGERAWAL